MKTKCKFYLAFLLAISAAASSSCGKDGDTVKPVIDLIEPEDGATLVIGDAHGVHLDMELSDDVMLQSYKVDIHPNFDGHDHEHDDDHDHDAAQRSTRAETVDFWLNKSWDVSGSKSTHISHNEIIIPANATPGHYHVMVYCTDSSGNVASVARGVVLSAEGGDGHDH